MTERDKEGDNQAIVAPVVLTVEITDTKLHVPVVTLSKENETKLSGQLKTGSKRTIKWKKYRSKMTVQPKNLQHLQTSTDYLFYHLQEPIYVIIETFFQTIMYQTLK